MTDRMSVAEKIIRQIYQGMTKKELLDEIVKLHGIGDEEWLQHVVGLWYLCIWIVLLWGGRIMAKYILTDWKGCDMYGDKPHVHIFKNKDELIQKLLGYLDDDIILEVVK